MQKQISTLIGIIIIVVVAVILFGGVFAYQYFSKPQQNSEFFAVRQKNNQTQIQTAGWKTYKNDDWGIEFKYPSTFGTFGMYYDILAFKNKTGLAFFLKKTTLEDVQKCQEELVECEKDPNNYPCVGCISAADWQEQKNFIETSKVGKFICDGAKTETKTDDCDSCEISEIGGIKILVEHGCWNPGGPTNIRVFYKNNTLFSFLPLDQSSADAFEKYGTDEKTILSTFKFTK